jgi:hypothetical protein
MYRDVSEVSGNVVYHSVRFQPTLASCSLLISLGVRIFALCLFFAKDKGKIEKYQIQLGKEFMRCKSNEIK